MIRGALQLYLGQRIEVQDISAEGVESTITITIAYRILRSGALSSASFKLGDST